MKNKHFFTVLVAPFVFASSVEAATVQAWIQEPSNSVEDSQFASAESKESRYGRTELSTANLENGTLHVSARSWDDYTESAAGAMIYADPTSPLMINDGSLLQPVEIVMDLYGIYGLPQSDPELAVASSVGLVSVLTSDGSGHASATHLVDYFEDSWRDGVIEDTSGGGSVSVLEDGSHIFHVVLSTGLVFLSPGEAATIIYMLQAFASNEARADFHKTAYLSIFVEDKSAFTFDPLIESWVYEFGEEGNGPGSNPPPPEVPLPAGAPLLLAGLAVLAGIRLRKT